MLNSFAISSQECGSYKSLSWPEEFCSALVNSTKCVSRAVQVSLESVEYGTMDGFTFDEASGQIDLIYSVKDLLDLRQQHSSGAKFSLAEGISDLTPLRKCTKMVDRIYGLLVITDNRALKPTYETPEWESCSGVCKAKPSMRAYPPLA